MLGWQQLCGTELELHEVGYSMLFYNCSQCSQTVPELFKSWQYCFVFRADVPNVSTCASSSEMVRVAAHVKRLK